MCRIVLIGCFLLVQQLCSQNLVPNPSFEDYDSCPQYNGDLFCTPWFNPTRSTPDYYNECWNGWWYDNMDVPINRFGAQAARTGQGYVGIAGYFASSPNAREYVSIRLFESLTPGTSYHLEFYVTLGDSSWGGSNKIGAHFSNTPDTMYAGSYIYNLPFQPQLEFDTVITDTTNWVKLSGNFVAAGGEFYLTIGVFKADSFLTYDSIQGDGSTRFSYYFIDDVSVTPYHPPTYPEITLFPNPSNGNFTINGNFPAGSELKIYNMLGQQVSETIPLPEGNNSVPFVALLAQGTYIARIEAAGVIVETLKIIIAE